MLPPLTPAFHAPGPTAGRQSPSLLPCGQSPMFGCPPHGGTQGSPFYVGLAQIFTGGPLRCWGLAYAWACNPLLANEMGERSWRGAASGSRWRPLLIPLQQCGLIPHAASSGALSLSPPAFTYQDPSDYIEPTKIIRDDLPTSRSALIPSATVIPLVHSIVYSQVLGIWSASWGLLFS